MGSDHNPTVIKLFEQSFYIEAEAQSGFNFSKADWITFKSKCRLLLTVANIASDDVNVYNEKFTRFSAPLQQKRLYFLSAHQKTFARWRRKTLKYLSRLLFLLNDNCKDNC